MSHILFYVYQASVSLPSAPSHSPSLRDSLCHIAERLDSRARRLDEQERGRRDLLQLEKDHRLRLAVEAKNEENYLYELYKAEKESLHELLKKGGRLRDQAFIDPLRPTIRDLLSSRQLTCYCREKVRERRRPPSLVAVEGESDITFLHVLTMSKPILEELKLQVDSQRFDRHDPNKWPVFPKRLQGEVEGKTSIARMTNWLQKVLGLNPRECRQMDSILRQTNLSVFSDKDTGHVPHDAPLHTQDTLRIPGGAEYPVRCHMLSLGHSIENYETPVRALWTYVKDPRPLQDLSKLLQDPVRADDTVLENLMRDLFKDDGSDVKDWFTEKVVAAATTVKDVCKGKALSTQLSDEQRVVISCLISVVCRGHDLLEAVVDRRERDGNMITDWDKANRALLSALQCRDDDKIPLPLRRLASLRHTELCHLASSLLSDEYFTFPPCPIPIIDFRTEAERVLAPFQRAVPLGPDLLREENPPSHLRINTSAELYAVSSDCQQLTDTFKRWGYERAICVTGDDLKEALCLEAYVHDPTCWSDKSPDPEVRRVLLPRGGMEKRDVGSLNAAIQVYLDRKYTAPKSRGSTKADTSAEANTRTGTRAPEVTPTPGPSNRRCKPPKQPKALNLMCYVTDATSAEIVWAASPDKWGAISTADQDDINLYSWEPLQRKPLQRNNYPQQNTHTNLYSWEHHHVVWVVEAPPADQKAWASRLECPELLQRTLFPVVDKGGRQYLGRYISNGTTFGVERATMVVDGQGVPRGGFLLEPAVDLKPDATIADIAQRLASGPWVLPVTNGDSLPMGTTEAEHATAPPPTSTSLAPAEEFMFPDLDL